MAGNPIVVDSGHRSQGTGGILGSVAQPVARFVSQFMKSGLLLAVEGFYCLRHRVSLRDVPLAHKLLSSLLVSPQLGLRESVTVIAAVESLFAQAEKDRRESIKKAREAFLPQMTFWQRLGGRTPVEEVFADVRKKQKEIVEGKIKEDTTAKDLNGRIAFIQSVGIAFAAANEEKRVLSEQALRLITSGMDAWERSCIIADLAKVPAEERESVVTQALRLITSGMSGWDRSWIIEAVAAVPAEERESVVTQALRLITPKMDGWDHRRIVEAVAEVPKGVRATFLEKFVSLNTFLDSVRKEDAFSIASKISQIATVFAPESDAVVTQMLQLMNSAMTISDYRYITSVVAELSPDEKESVVTQAVRIIPSNVDWLGCGTIIKDVAGISKEERESVITQALLLITPEQKEWECSMIIAAVAGVPAEERESVIEQALRLIPLDEMHTQSLSEIIKAVAKVPAREREDVIELLLHIITPEMNFLTRVAIAHAAAAVPAAERADFIALTVEGIIPGLFTPTMSVSVCFEIIAVVSTVPTQERRDFIGHLQNDVLNPVIQGRDRVIAIQREAEIIVRRAHRHPEEREEIVRRHGVDVHEGDRDQRAKEAFERLRAAQPAFSQNQIAGAKDQFVAFLEEFPLDPADKALAKKALLAPKESEESFGPLLDREGFTLLGLRTTGEELIGRLWLFASRLSEPEQTNAKMGMITVLRTSYEGSGRVCNQGKMHRLLIAVLQGRLAGVNIDGKVATIQVPTSQAMTMFFQVPAHQEIEELQALLVAAEAFCRENPAVNRQEFLVQIREYAALQGIE